MKASVVVLCLAAIGLAGCSSGGSKSTTATTVAVSTSTNALSTSTTVAGVADGRVPAFLKTIDVTGRAITYDQIQFLTGAEAKAAWVKDHPEQPDGPDDDYYIKNVNPKLYTVRIAVNAIVTLNNLAPSNPSSGDQPATLDQLAKAFADKDFAKTSVPFWLTISGGQITKIEEQFTP